MTSYRLLGPFEAVQEDGRPLDLGGPKQRAVLAVLLLERGRVVSTDRLMATLWGEDLPASAAGSLQVYVSNLRRLLRAPDATSPIVRQPPGYVMQVAADDVDVFRFVAGCGRASAAADLEDWPTAVALAEAALADWRGPLLGEYAEEEWVRLAAVPLEERRTGCEQTLVTALLGCDQVPAALARARSLHAAQPLSERAAWLEMVALYRAGRSPEALEVFRRQADVLDTELGLEPGPALRDLQGAVLRQDAGLARWPRHPDRRSPPGVVEPERTVPAPPPPTAAEAPGTLVGRQRELAAVADLLDAPADGRPRWLVLSGSAGIGKSRLAEEIASGWQRRGGRVCRTSCPDDQVPPWWPIGRLLRAVGADPERLLVPPAGVDADAARYLTYERVTTALTEAAADGPLLLLVEDVHWADPTSLRFLTYLAETAQQGGLVLLLTTREETRPELTRLLAAVARGWSSLRVSLPPLAVSDVAVLAAQVGGRPVPASEAARLTVRTGGNPFFVCEYARLPEEERQLGQVPPGIHAVMERRLARLDPEVLRVLRIAAVSGDPLDLGLVAEVARLDPDDLADLLDEAADESILVPAPGGGAYMFAHALLRDEVLAGLTVLRQQRLHLQTAAALERRGAPASSVRRAAHLLAAGPTGDARAGYEACVAVAEEADRTWQSETAAQWWQNALHAYDRLPPEQQTDDRDELIIAQVAALARNGRGQTVLDVVEASLLEAVRHARWGSAGRLAATLLRTSGAWPWAVYGAEPGPLLALLTDVEPLVRDHPAAHARILSTLAVGRFHDPDTGAPDRLSRQALDLAEASDDPDLLADALLGRALAFSAITQRATESVALLDRLGSLPHRLAQVDDVLRHTLLTMALTATGDAAAAAEHLRLGGLGSDLLRLPVARVQLRWMEGSLALWHGDLERARALYATAAELHEQTELYLTGVADLAELALRWEEGSLDAGFVRGLRDPAAVPWAAAVVAAATGDPAAEDLLVAELDRSDQITWTTQGRLTLLAHAVADAGLVRHAGPLRRRLAPFAPYIANVGQVGVIGTVALALARLCLLEDDLDAAEQHLAAARGLAHRADGRAAALRGRLVAAELQVRRGAAVERSRLRALAREARSLGLLGVAGDADRLAGAAEGGEVSVASRPT